MPTDDQIIRNIQRQPKRSAGYKQLVRELGVHGEGRSELAERLEQLVSSGALVREEAGQYALPQANSGKNMLVGRLSLHRDGFGFVIPDANSLDSRMKSQLAGDVFIPPPFVGSAMHGDRVLVEVAQIRPDGRAEGRIVRPLVRAHPTVVGKFHYGRRNYVTAWDERISQEIVIPPGKEYPEPGGPELGAGRGEEGEGRQNATAAARESKDSRAPASHGEARVQSLSRHRVFGEGAARTGSWPDIEGLIVDVEITDWPTATQNPRGKVVEILGKEDDFGIDVEIMIRKHHLPHRFPEETLEEARAIPSSIAAPELATRRDYRDLPIVTIDGETARDFDDAIHVGTLDNGNYELQVHIADVAHYVAPGSALDQEARLRGTSVYFPDRAVPMLPMELSTDICSLRPHVDRLVLSCTMEIDHRGEIVGYQLNQGVIRSAERMTYTAVNAVLEGDKALRARYAPLAESFERMRDLAMILNRKRERRGSIDFDLPEPVIEFDEFGLMRSVTRSERNIAHRLIEEFMLSANECVAHYLENKRVASLYRIHEKPDAKRVFDFEVLAAAFGYSLGVGALPIQRMQFKDERRANRGTGKRPREIEIPQSVHVTPRMYQKLAEKIAGKPEERILSYLMLRSLKQARYSEENAGHFALAAPTYTHFTSPIRRYPDLIVHRILKSVLRDSPEQMDENAPVGLSSGVDIPKQQGGPEPSSLSLENNPRQSKTRLAGMRQGRQGAETGSAPSPWSKRRDHAAHQEALEPVHEPISIEELHDIAEESSQSERRADEAERELMEWKKTKFMQERIGEDFAGLIISVTKFGFFVELKDLFVEGLVPLTTLVDDRYTFHENTRQIIGQRTRRTFSLGQSVHVLVDRIDPVEKKIQFALAEVEVPHAANRKKDAKRKRS